MTDEDRAAHRAACEGLLARLIGGEKLRVLLGDGTVEPASQIVLTGAADRTLRDMLARGLKLEIGDDPGPSGPAPAMAEYACGDGTTGD